MAFFPESIMPNIRKKNASPVVGTILAESFNLHTDEIIAIERFLGLSAADEADVNDLLDGHVDPANIIGILKLLVETMNIVSEGVLQTSGHVHHGQRMIFPEGATTTFLKTAPAPTDHIITVFSTLGFPDSGIITILNDIDLPVTTGSDKTTVEIIKYSGKTGTRFLNCERGIDRTTIGPHSAGFIPVNSSSTGSTNLADQCNIIPINLKLCNRRYPGWRFKTQLFFPAFDLVGTFVEIVRDIRRDPLAFSLTSQRLGTSYDAILNAATVAGILADAPDGSQILKSADTTYSAVNQLTWLEAIDFVGTLITAEVILTLSQPATWKVGGTPFIPVFQGRMAVQHSIAALTMNPTAAASATPASFAAVSSAPFSVSSPTTTTSVVTNTGPAIGVGTVTNVAFFGAGFAYDNANTPSDVFRITQVAFRGVLYDLTLPAGNEQIAIARIDGTNFGDINTQQFIFNEILVDNTIPLSVGCDPIDSVNGAAVTNTQTTRWVILRSGVFVVVGGIAVPRYSNAVLRGNTVNCTHVNTGGQSATLITTNVQQLLQSGNLNSTTLVPPPAIVIPPTAIPPIFVSSPSTTPPSYLSKVGIQQTADGRLYVKLATDQEQDKADQAVIQYKTFFTPSFRTRGQKDSF